MKKIYLLTKVCFFAAMMFFAAACTEEDAVVTPIFPEGETVETVVPGTEYTLTFSANMNWELESSKPWCKFSNGFQSVKGEAGENISQKLTIDEPTTFDAEVAEITLIMGGEKKVIAKYTREGMAPLVTDADGNLYSDENPLTFLYTTNGVKDIFSFVANFSWTLSDSDLPEWIKIDEESVKGGNANEKVQISFYIPKSYWLSALDGNIKIKNSEIGCEFNVPVKFAGVPDGEIVTDGINGTAYWWRLAADGKTFWRDGSLSGEEYDVIDLPFAFKVMTKGNAYKVVHVEQSGQWLNVIENQWSMPFMSISDDENGNIEIKSVLANETGSERSAYILVMPTVVYEEMMQKVEDTGGIYDGILFTDEGDGINAGDDTHVNYDKYTVLAFKQDKQESTEGEFIVSNALSALPIECLPGDGGTGLSDYLISEYSLDKSKIYSIAVGKNSSISIDPMLSMSEWMPDGDINKSVIAQDFSGNVVDITQWGLGLNTSETGFVFSSIPVNDSFFIIFKDTDLVNKKALIIQVNE